VSFLESVIQKTRRLERLLEENYQASGKGVHEKATSVERKLDSNTLKQIRFIASVRNKLMHEDDYRFDGDESGFLRKCDEVIERLTIQQTQTKTYAAPQSLQKPVQTIPRSEPVRSTSRTSTTDLLRTEYTPPSSSTYSSSGSLARGASRSNNANSSIGDILRPTFQALLAGVFLYPVIGLGGCITRLVVQGSPPHPMLQTQAHDTWLYSPLKAWTTEAIIIPLLIVAVTFFVGLFKIEVNPLLRIFLFLLGAAATIYVGSGLINLVRRNSTATLVSNSGQAGTVGTMREVNTINLNMRSGPGANYPVIATFPKQSRIVSYGETRNVDAEVWTQASTPDGRIRGWVNRKFLSP
jgi:hypothetical protein